MKEGKEWRDGDSGWVMDEFGEEGGIKVSVRVRDANARKDDSLAL